MASTSAVLLIGLVPFTTSTSPLRRWPYRPLPRVPGLAWNFQARTITVSWGLSFANGVDQWNWPTVWYRDVACGLRRGVQLMTGMWPFRMTLTIWPVQPQGRPPGRTRLLVARSLRSGPFGPIDFSATHGVGRYDSQRHWCTMLIRGKCQRRWSGAFAPCPPTIATATHRRKRQPNYSPARVGHAAARVA